MFKKRFPSLSSLGSDGNTAFLRAARAGHLDKVLEHLRANIDINTSNSNGLNALHLASKDGHVAVVTELLKRGAVVDAATKKGNTALHIASLAGQEEVVKLLVANGAAVNVQSQNGFTPLYMAAQENHDNVVRFLLANGANQSLATEDGFTPLAVAMQQGHDKVVAVLLENDTRGKVRLPALHIAAKKDDCKAAALLLQNDHNPDVTSKSGFTPLHIAAHYGNESIANLLLNRGADVNYSAKHNITPLHVAAKWGKTNMVSLLLSKGANIESKTRDGLTPLHCAARSGHEQVVDMMLERGAPISCKTKNGLAPLHMASQGDHVDAARILLYHRAPVDEVTVDYLTALHVAAHCGHVRVAKLLLDRKADPNARALNGFTPLHIACKKNRIKVVELLLKHGASIEATTESGLTPLHVASFMGCMNIVIYLLQHDANPDVPTVRGETPLHLAARANQTDIIRILLRNGAQVDARAREQQTPLHIASRLGNVDIVMLLLQHGAAVDSTTKDMYTALHIAGKEGQEEVASVLLEHGASLTATTKKGLTPLHLAAKYGNMKVAKLLLQRDAPVDAQGKNGVTPLHVASHYDHQNVALLLLDKGASPHATAKNGHTPLHIAARKNQMDIATTLLEYGAKANAESKAGFTPLHLSSQEGHTDMSTLLIEHQADTNQKAKNGLTPLHLCAQEDRVNVATILVKNGAQVDSATKAGYTPLHVASHFGQVGMVRFLLQHRANVAATTALGYTPLHQAAQQGHAPIVNILLENKAPPNVLTNQGQTALSIAHKLGYISVVESLKVVTEAVIPTTTSAVTEEKYRVVAPEMMQETFMSDSEDEGGEDTMLSDQPYRYLTVDEMKSLGDDSLPIDVTRDERIDSNRESPPTAVDDTISPQHIKDSHSQFAATFTPDNIDISKHPIHIGFLVSFLVDARGGAMRGCRHSGVRVIVPPRRAAMPTRVTCRYLKRDKLTHPPPLMEGEALASRILELGPVGAKFLGPVIIEVPHFGSLRGMEREIVILRSDNGETWREHTTDASDEAVHEVLNESFEGEELSVLEDVTSGRTTRILTNDFPQYFAVVSRIRQEVHAIGPEGGMVSSSVVPQVQAVFPQGALTKKIKVGLQAQPIAAELAAKLLGNRVAVSPIVTVEPRRRKFHKPITLTIPVPQAANKGMINQYSGDAPTLRLLCSITGGTTRAQWEDVTGSTPLTFVNDCVSFTTTVSARFWLMDCRNIGEATKMATELYKEAIHVPFMAKFVVFAKRVDVLEARLRVFCMTDDKEDKTLEHQEHFTEVAKSRDVEVLEGKPQYVEFAGNLVPVTKSGDQLQLGFRAFRENRLPFTVRVKDPHADTVGRILFMREPKIAKGEPPQQPVCILNIVLPETILPESGLSEPDIISLQKKYSFLRDGGIGRPDVFQCTNLRLSDLSNLLAEDWVPLANELGVNTSEINIIKTEFPSSVAQQAMGMLRLWLQQAGNKATASTLENALRKIGREDIIQQCIFNADETEKIEKICEQSGFDSLKEEFGTSRDTSLKRDVTIDMTSYDEQDLMKESESVEELVQAEKREPIKDGRISTVDIIPKKWPAKVKDDEIEETKYIGEEKVVEEERRTVAQLKEIFAQDKRDRQYERQPLIIQEEDIVRRPIARTTDNESTRPPSTVDEDTSRLSTSTFEDSTIEDDIAKRQTSSPEQSSDEIMKSSLDADQRRDSELFQGVSEGLVRLETTHKVMPSTEEILSPKISKTPPPSPAEFKESAGVATWQHSSLLPTEPPAPTQGQADASKPQDMKTESSNVTQNMELQGKQVEESLLTMHPIPSPRLTSHEIQKTCSQKIDPIDSQMLSDKVEKLENLQNSEQVVEDVKSYSDRKKFWEEITGGQSKQIHSASVSETKQEIVAPPQPKPRTAAPIIAVLQESVTIKSETESDTETTTFSDSTIRMHPPSEAVSKQSTFTGSSDTSDREGSEPEALETASAPVGVPATVNVAAAFTSQQVAHTESSDSEPEYLAKLGGECMAFENTAFVSDDEAEDTGRIFDKGIYESSEPKTKRVLEKYKSEDVKEVYASHVKSSLDDSSTPTARKTIYERSVSLPTADLLSFDQNGSVRAKKRYFEAQIKKEMVVEQLMTQLEEETSPEHKAIHYDTESTLPVETEQITNMKPEVIGEKLTCEKKPCDTEIFMKELEDKGMVEPLRTKPDKQEEIKESEFSSSIEDDMQASQCGEHISVKEISKTYESQVKQSSQDLKGNEYENMEGPERKTVKDIRCAFEKPKLTDGAQSQPTESTTDKPLEIISYDPETYRIPSDENDGKSYDISFQIAEVMQYKSETISKPSDSLEVHVDKSETEDTEKEIDEDIKAIEKHTTKIITSHHGEQQINEEEIIPSITVTFSGKQRTDSYSQGESEDTASESDVTPEEAHIVYQPEEHIHDTVWEVPVQEDSQAFPEETVQEISEDKQHLKTVGQETFIKEEPDGFIQKPYHRISEEEARAIAEEVIDSIEAEVSKHDALYTVQPPVPPPELAETQVTEYLRQITGKEVLEPREVQLVESVLAKKHREQIKKFSRTDTTTSSMEITDEDLRSSGVETDLSPLESQAGKLIAVEDSKVTDDSVYCVMMNPNIENNLMKTIPMTESQIPQTKLEDVETVEKALAEVRESLEAAQEQLIEEQKHTKEHSMQKKKSPSEFEFKLMSFENKFDERIEESYSEEYSASVDFMEKDETGKIFMKSTDATVKEISESKGESEKIERAEILISEGGIEEEKETIFKKVDRKYMKSKESNLNDIAIEKRKDIGLIIEKRISANFVDEEDRSLSSETSEIEVKTKGDLHSELSKKEKETITSIGENKVLISNESKLGDTFIEKDFETIEKSFYKKEGKGTDIEEIQDVSRTGKTSSVFKQKQTEEQTVDECTRGSVHSSKLYDTESKSTSYEHSTQPVVQHLEKSSTGIKGVKYIEEDNIQDIKMDTSGIKSTHKIDFSSDLEISEQKILKEKQTEKEEIKRASSEESQRSLSQDESVKSPVETISSSSSSGRRIDSETVRVIERPDGTEATVLMRHPESSSSGERSVTLRADRRSGADFEAWSSSGESHYHSFEQTSESGRTYSRPCSSDVEALVAGIGGGTTGSSEYESALTSQELSMRSTATSHEYHTAVSSLSSRESMKSLDSESSGHLASIEVSSDASETLVPSALELERDMEGVGTVIMDEESISEDTSFKKIVEPYDTNIPSHVIRGESLKEDQFFGSHLYKKSSSEDQMIDEEDGKTSPFELITSTDVLALTRDNSIIDEDSENKDSLLPLSIDCDERPHCMKRSHEMIFQPEPRRIITDSPLSETGDIHDEKLGSSVEEGSIFSISSTSDTGALRTVIELSRADSERMDLSATSEQLSMTVSGTSELSLEEIEATTCTAQTQLVDSGTCTLPPASSHQELPLSSVTITTSSIDESGIQSVCTQVTSQSQIVTLDSEDSYSLEDIKKEDCFAQSNGPTQVEYIPEYDDFEDTHKRTIGHRRKESTSNFSHPGISDKVINASVISENDSKHDTYTVEDMAESDKYKDTAEITLKEVRSDEKKDIDEAEKLEESYQTEADQGFHRDLREGRIMIEETSSIDEDPETELKELDSSRPQSQVSKSDSESQRPMSSGFSDDRPDSELAELLKQCSSDGKEFEDPIERPYSPEPVDECEIKDDTPEFSSEAQASVTELEMEYSGAFSRVPEYASHVSPVHEEHLQDEICSEDMAEAEAAFQVTPHAVPPATRSLPATISEDSTAEKHELETGERSLKELKRDITITSPNAIPDITVTQHMTPLIDKGFHYPDLELEEVAQSSPQTPASVSSRASSETETDQGREYVLDDGRLDDFISEELEPEENIYSKTISSQSIDEISQAEEKTVYESKEKVEPKHKVESPVSDSPTSDSFEMLEKPDLTDDYVVVEEVGKEAEEHDTEGKSVHIQKSAQLSKKHVHKSNDDVLIESPPAPTTRLTNLKYYPETNVGDDVGPFPFEDSPPTASTAKKSAGVRVQEGSKCYVYDGDDTAYEREVEAGKKWIEMQFQGDSAASSVAGYGYEMDFERAPLEDIKEEEVNDFDQSSSKVGSVGSYQASTIGSFGSIKESLSSTPEYDVLAGRKFFSRSGEHDDISMSSLQEFEHLEHQLALEAARKRSHGSQDSLNGANNKKYASARSGQGDDISLSSLKEFEGLESACIEATKIEIRAKEEEEALLSEIEEGHESQVSESESCETMSVGGCKIGGESIDSDDYEKRMFEIDEIIRQAQSNVERFVDGKDKLGEDGTESSMLDRTESVGRGDSMEEVARVPELDLDQPTHHQKYLEGSKYYSEADDVMKTSTDSLDLRIVDHLHASTDSLDLKTVAEKTGDIMTASADSIEFQAHASSGPVDIMTDSIELTQDFSILRTSTDSLDLAGSSVVPGNGVMTDSIEEEEEASVHGLGGQGSGSGGHDQSSSSGREGDLSSSGKEDNSGEPGIAQTARTDGMLGSTDSLEPSSSTATHATYQYETDSVMSSSFTSGGSNTMVSSTDTLDPSGAVAGGIDALDLVAAAAHSGLWFDENNISGGPFVTEVIDPSEDNEFSHTVRRTVTLPPEVQKVTFHGPDAERALQEYVENFSPGEDISETQEVDSEGNIHVKRIVQRRIVIRSEDDTDFQGSEYEGYFRHASEDQTGVGSFPQSRNHDVTDSDYKHLMTSISGTESSPHSIPSYLPEVVTHHTYVTRHVIPSAQGAVVETQQGQTTPHLTEKQESEGNAELAMKDSTARDEAEVDPNEQRSDGATESAESPQTARDVKQGTQATASVPSLDSNKKEFPH